MLEQGGGAIVNVASVNAFFQPDAATIDYGAARRRCSTSASRCPGVGPRGIHVNCVSPGPVETDLWLGDQGVAATVGNAAGIAPAAVREQTAAGIASRRFSTPQEVATLVALLASPRTANVTGANYVIDGGLVKNHVTPGCRPGHLTGAKRPAWRMIVDTATITTQRRSVMTTSTPTSPAP